MLDTLKGENIPDYNGISYANKEISIRTKDELLRWGESLEFRNAPDYIEISDANYSQVCINGKWRTTLCSWSLVFAGGKWKYVETDDERGYVSVLKEFDDEESAVKCAKRHLNIYYLTSFKYGTVKDTLRRYLQKNYNCSEKQSYVVVKQISRYRNALEEFFDYVFWEKFCKRNEEPIEVCGYTAEILNRNYKMSPLEAYLFLVRLKRNPEKALADLKVADLCSE